MFEEPEVGQIYLPLPRLISRPMHDEDRPNTAHLADLLYLADDKVGRKTYKYALTVVYVVSRYKEAETLIHKNAAEVAAALSRTYNYNYSLSLYSSRLTQGATL